jgi:hypothetical protein
MPARATKRGKHRPPTERRVVIPALTGEQLRAVCDGLDDVLDYLEEQLEPISYILDPRRLRDIDGAIRMAHRLSSIAWNIGDDLDDTLTEGDTDTAAWPPERRRFMLLPKLPNLRALQRT